MSDKLQAEREWTQAELCELLPPDVMWQDNLTPELLRYVLSRASLSSSQQVREEALNAAADAAHDAIHTEINEINECARVKEAIVDAILSLKSTPASPSQPSSVEMTDAHEIWAAAQLLPGEGIEDGVRRIEQLLQSSPKGASKHYTTDTEVFTIGTPQPISMEEGMGLVKQGLQRVRGASKPQHHAACDRKYPTLCQACLTEWESPQPSAASGRELPPLPEPDRRFRDDLGAGRFVDTKLYTAYQMGEYALAALTGAAPADANAIPVRIHAHGGAGIHDYEMSDGTIKTLAHGEARDMMRATPTAPEPSAPADKDTELARLREIARLIGSIFVHGEFKAETFNERELEKLLREQGTFWDSLADFDAAIDRMRSEDGKGGKL